jgi:hypothetical protein
MLNPGAMPVPPRMRGEPPDVPDLQAALEDLNAGRVEIAFLDPLTVVHTKKTNPSLKQIREFYADGLCKNFGDNRWCFRVTMSFHT